MGYQLDSVLQAQGPCHVGRRNLSDTVPDHGIGFDPPGAP